MYYLLETFILMTVDFSDFSSETMEPEEIETLFKCWQKRTVHLEFYIQWQYSVGMKVKKFSEGNNNEFVSSRPALKEWWKGSLQTERKWYQKENWNIRNEERNRNNTYLGTFNRLFFSYEVL